MHFIESGRIIPRITGRMFQEWVAGSGRNTQSPGIGQQISENRKSFSYLKNVVDVYIIPK